MAELAIIAYLGLGSNLGDRAANIRQARRCLDATNGIRVRDVSSIYETEPWGVTEQPRFLNCAVGIETSLDPAQLLESVKTIERDMGRVATIRYGPRPIDIDILLYGDSVIDSETPDLKIPHARIVERAFVLVPLAEVAGEVWHPTALAPIAVLADRVGDRDGVRYWGELRE